MLDRCPALRDTRHRAQRAARRGDGAAAARRARAAAAVLRRGVRLSGDRGAAARGAGSVQRHPGVARDRRRGARIPRPARRTGLASGDSRLRGAGIAAPRRAARAARRLAARRAGTRISRPSIALSRMCRRSGSRRSRAPVDRRAVYGRRDAGPLPGSRRPRWRATAARSVGSAATARCSSIRSRPPRAPAPRCAPRSGKSAAGRRVRAPPDKGSAAR